MASSTPDEMIERALAAFNQDFPQLVMERERQWVAYHGARRIGFGNTRDEAWQECLRRGLPEGEFWVFNIQPIIGQETTGLGGCKVEYTK